jgi:2-polyprenyl-3-methyl-5-hydroxy-6-metoxy-1,4-benzoquinol methylase
VNDFPIQVDRHHYFTPQYNHKARWVSYFYQLAVLRGLGVHSILEIGPGNGWMSHVLKSLGYDVKTVDVDPELSPDYVAHISRLPFKDGMFDVVCAFEVLEHMPFEEFSSNLKEMARVAKKNVVISLPDHRRTIVDFSLKIPFIKNLFLFIKIPSLQKHVFDGQHYWEIGKWEYSVKKIKQAISQSGLVCIKNFVPHDAPMNHYFLLQK